MLPYFYYPTCTVGFLTFQTWGFFVTLGILVAIFIATKSAKKKNIETKHVWDAVFWVIIAAFIGARFGHVFFYNWVYFSQNLWDIPKIWLGGFSSYGGFAGAAIAAILYIKKYKLNFSIFSDILVVGLPLGWAIGRIGCFLIHDHPGKISNFILGVNYPDGIRHDLGLYDSLNALILAIVIFIFHKTFEKKPGLILAVVSLWYGSVRFFLDFLRATDGNFSDPRYFGLTPGQYGSILLFGLGIVLLFRVSRTLKS